MTAVRIALSLLLAIGIWVLILPAEPSLLAPSAPDASLRPETATGGEPTRQAEFREVAPPVRQIVPSPLAQGGELQRLPSVSSGAAVPQRDEPASAPEAPADAPASVLPPLVEVPAEAQTAEASPGGDAAAAGPEYRLFARPIAVDSATLRIGEITVRIAGVDPIAPEARCADGPQSWPCGARARTAFRGWLRGRSVLCGIPGEEVRAVSLTVPCLLGEQDVGAWLVRNGWATASPDSRYAEDEAAARQARAGVWAFDQPL